MHGLPFGTNFNPEVNFHRQFKVSKLSIVLITKVDIRHCLDSAFVATLYTSDSDKIFRYTDEGETAELCKWTVDLSSLPTFRENASLMQMNGFYTGKLMSQVLDFFFLTKERCSRI